MRNINSYEHLNKLTKQELIMLVSEKVQTKSSNDAVTAVRSLIKDWTRENFIVIALNHQNEIIKSKNMFVGTTGEASVYPKEIYIWALKTKLCTRIIIAHNHPSGSLKASDNDYRITNKIEEGCKLIGLNLLDSLIVTPLDHVSLTW